MVLLPEAMRRFQEMTAMMQQSAMQFPEDHVLMINTAHPLIENIYQLSQGAIVQADGTTSNQSTVDMLCQHVYDLALIAQKGFDADGMKAFVERSNQVLTRLSEK
jgi:molecular chaperone HtpG